MLRRQGMTATGIVFRAAASVGAAAVLCGCVSPGDLDMGQVARYQREMAGRGPQARAGQAGVDLLRPASPSVGPKLQIITDEKTREPTVYLSLNEAIMLALANSPEIRVASYDPELSREDMTIAAAEFDYIVFGSAVRERTDEQVSTALAASESDTRTFQMGVRQKFITGAQWSTAWTMTRTWDNSAFSGLPTRWEPTLGFTLTQPLLRDGWPEFNLARLRVARLNYKINVAGFRSNAERTLTDVIRGYWLLAQARRDLDIAHRLLASTVETKDRVDARREVDATDVEFKQAVSAVASRRAEVAAAEKIVQDAEDALARLLADPQLNLVSDCRIVPTDPLDEAAAEMDMTDQVLAALRHNPQLAQARLAIAIAGVNVRVARNQTLPRLDFVSSATVQGLDGALHEATENLFTNDFVSYSFGLQAEYPIGNRERLAQSRQARLSRRKAISQYQNSADLIAQQVRERVRQVRTSAQEMKLQAEAVQAAKAKTEALRALIRIKRMTPELLDLELNSLRSQAISESTELRAIVSYHIALAELARVTGSVFELHGVQLALPAPLGPGKNN